MLIKANKNETDMLTLTDAQSSTWLVINLHDCLCALTWLFYGYCITSISFVQTYIYKLANGISYLSVKFVCQCHCQSIKSRKYPPWYKTGTVQKYYWGGGSIPILHNTQTNKFFVSSIRKSPLRQFHLLCQFRQLAWSRDLAQTPSLTSNFFFFFIFPGNCNEY